jgi:phage-related protein
MQGKKFRKVVYYKDYLSNFLRTQTINVKKKIIWTLELVEEIELIPENYLKRIKGTEGLYEVRVNSGTNTFRIFCFFSGNKLVILMNAFQKKTRKTPKAEIQMALKIKEEYEQENK